MKNAVVSKRRRKSFIFIQMQKITIEQRSLAFVTVGNLSFKNVHPVRIKFTRYIKRSYMF